MFNSKKIKELEKWDKENCEALLFLRRRIAALEKYLQIEYQVKDTHEEGYVKKEALSYPEYVDLLHGIAEDWDSQAKNLHEGKSKKKK